MRFTSEEIKKNYEQIDKEIKQLNKEHKSELDEFMSNVKFDDNIKRFILFDINNDDYREYKYEYKKHSFEYL